MDDQRPEQKLAKELIAQLGESTLFALLTAVDEGADVYTAVCDELAQSNSEVLQRYLGSTAKEPY